MKDKILKVSNLDCPMCADKLETSLKAINGVGSVNVDFLLQKISVSYTTDGVLKEVIDFINNFEEVKVKAADI
jgi:copper chaperone CopZ